MTYVDIVINAYLQQEKTPRVAYVIFAVQDGNEHDIIDGLCDTSGGGDNSVYSSWLGIQCEWQWSASVVCVRERGNEMKWEFCEWEWYQQ